LAQGRDLLTGTVTRYIVGYKKEESDWLLKFLYDHIALSQDLQTRVRWLPGTVVVWDVSILSLHSGKY
jgi:sulfonate dioxygenase